MITVLRTAVVALADGDTASTAAIVGQVQPESPSATVATVAECDGSAPGMLDEWLSGTDPRVPNGLGQQVRQPAGHWRGQRAATDVLALARKGRAFRSLTTLIARPGGEYVLYGSVLALAATALALGRADRHDGGRPATDEDPLTGCAAVPATRSGVRCRRAVVGAKDGVRGGRQRRAVAGW